jgi:hypothetical protein
MFVRCNTTTDGQTDRQTRTYTSWQGHRVRRMRQAVDTHARTHVHVPFQCVSHRLAPPPSSRGTVVWPPRVVNAIPKTTLRPQVANAHIVFSVVILPRIGRGCHGWHGTLSQPHRNRWGEQAPERHLSAADRYSSWGCTKGLAGPQQCGHERDELQGREVLATTTAR